LLAEADRLRELVELVGAASLPGHERMILLAGRVLREGVLQQSALTPNDAHSTGPKTAALIDAVLSVVDRCEQLIEQGSTATEIEELDLSPLLRAASQTRPDDVAAVRARGEQTLAVLAERQ
jgi:V/A-type H+-transporting ATPase subunit A